MNSRDSAFWGKLSIPWQVCLEEAWASYCAGCTPIGAAIVGPEGAIIGRGRNRIGEASDSMGIVKGTVLAHAELNALIAFPQQDYDPHLCRLYSALEPCPLCLGALYMSGLRQLYYAAADPFAGSVNLLGRTPYLSRKPIQVFGPTDPVLEQIILAMQIDFFLRRDDDRAGMVLESWRVAKPDAIQFGQRLFAENHLPDLQASRATAENAFDFLAGLLNTHHS